MALRGSSQLPPHQPRQPRSLVCCKTHSLLPAPARGLLACNLPAPAGSGLIAACQRLSDRHGGHRACSIARAALLLGPGPQRPPAGVSALAAALRRARAFRQQVRPLAQTQPCCQERPGRAPSAALPRTFQIAAPAGKAALRGRQRTRQAGQPRTRACMQPACTHWRWPRPCCAVPPSPLPSAGSAAASSLRQPQPAAAAAAGAHEMMTGAAKAAAAAAAVVVATAVAMLTTAARCGWSAAPLAAQRCSAGPAPPRPPGGLGCASLHAPSQGAPPAARQGPGPGCQQACTRSGGCQARRPCWRFASRLTPWLTPTHRRTRTPGGGRGGGTVWPLTQSSPSRCCWNR